jgi:hypothetical protein
MMSIEKAGLVVGVVVGAVGVAIAALAERRAERLARKVDMSVTDLAEKTPVAITDALISKAVDAAVNREVGTAITNASSAAVQKVATDMSTKVSNAINESYANVKDSVTAELTKQVERIDIERLKADVTEKAKAAAVKKLDGSMNEILKEFEHNLENVPKIYGAMLGSMAKRQDNGFSIKIG